MSREGLFLQTTSPLVPGSRIDLHVEMSSQVVVRLTGRVVWARAAPPELAGRKRSGMGIELDGPFPDEPGTSGNP